MSSSFLGCDDQLIKLQNTILKKTINKCPNFMHLIIILKITIITIELSPLVTIHNCMS